MPAFKGSVTGVLANDPRLVETERGGYRTHLDVKVEHKWTNFTTGSTVTSESILPVVVFGQRAKNAARTLKRGHRAVLMGRLELRAEVGPDGNQTTKAQIVVEDIGASLADRTWVPEEEIEDYEPEEDEEPELTGTAL